MISGPADQPDEVFLIPGQSDRPGDNPIDPRAFCVGGPGSHIVPIDTFHVRLRQHRLKLTIF
jgi:hypothetical protein